MKNVTRLSEPEVLKRNAARWKRELLQEIQLAKRQNRKPDNKFYDRYNHHEVKDTLSRMYKRLCCYCEAPLKVVTKGHIEHRKPKKGKSAFPELTFDWNNLHLVCPTCNSCKGDKWNKEHEILDAVCHRPISDHLTYEIESIGVFRSAITGQGRTTVEHADLNREDLLEARTKVLLGTLKVITEIKRLQQNPQASSKVSLLKTISKREYGSLVEYAIEGFLQN
jgi:uncharacterized protein (TIGR02646 family)